MKFLRTKRGIGVVVVLLLVLFLWRPGVHRLRNRIAGSIGRALGRTVTIDNVRLRLLPRPGFDLEGLVIADDAAFSAEPMIRAQEVSAAIRLRSLLRGHLEIATLSATEPSINLVRNSEGHWNLAVLIERSAKIPAAPTAKPASERRPAFPYLEATNARVNFKIGQIKKSYALMDADVALWQDSENSWGARIKAAPVRTDFNLTDTGLVQIDATWQRAESLRLTPVQISAQWDKGQLGQITQLLSGKDRGWRGGASLAAKVLGTAEALRVETQAIVDDFHRYDIVQSERLRLAATCSGQYNAVALTISDLLCESPVSTGAVQLRGSYALENATPQYDLALKIEKVPLASAVGMLRQSKKQIPNDLAASGQLNGEFHAKRSGGSVDSEQALPQWAGSGSATDVRLLRASSGSQKNAIDLGTIRLEMVTPESEPSKHVRANSSGKEQEPDGPHLRIGPAAISIGGTAPAVAGGWVSTSGYSFYLRGDAQIRDLFRVSDTLGLPSSRPAAEGFAKLDLNVSGIWQGFGSPVVLGAAQLRNVHVEVRGLNTPVEIASANVVLTAGSARLQKIAARTAGTHWTGEAIAPRQCGSSSPPPNICPYQFDLSADQLSTDDLARWFTPQAAKRPWYRILNSDESQGPSQLLALQARGILHIGRVELKKVTATQVSTQVDVDRGKITLTSLRGQLFRGTHVGNWVLEVANRDNASKDVGSRGVSYHGSGMLQNIALDQVGAAMNDSWISGTGDGKFDWQGSGTSLQELLASSSGSLQFVMRNGALARMALGGSTGPLSVHRFAGDLHVEKGLWKVSDGKLESRDGLYTVSGTASAASGFDFVLKRSDDQTWGLTGTLAKPHVTPKAQTEARRLAGTAKPVKIAEP